MYIAIAILCIASMGCLYHPYIGGPIFSKQCEKHYPNGTKEIHFPNDTVKYIYPNGEEESIFPDGLSQRNFPNGNVTLHMPNGIKEYYTSDYKVGAALDSQHCSVSQLV